MHSRFLILTVMMILAGCGHSASGEMGGQDEILPGKVYGHVACRENPGNSYALYLPSSYLPGDSVPLVLAFDPAGSGILPVDLYQEIAESYRFILVGSNDSKNGQGPEATQQIIAALLTDLDRRFSFDQNRIYCAGFSGGSRVSSLIAFYGGGIKGVIACGAGLPATSTPFRYRSDYYGIVGDEDFNYLEMVGLALQFNKQGLPNSLRIFHGPHAWPPPKVVESAFRWHWSIAMKEGLIPSDPEAEMKSRNESEENLTKLNAVDIGRLEMERDQQQYYIDCMQSKERSWWEAEMNRLYHPEDLSDTLRNKRLVNYLGVIAYSFSNQALAGRNRQELSRLIGIYETVDPKNSYIATLKEQLNRLP